MKRLLLLGAGPAHLHLLRELARQPMAAAEVALVSAHARRVHPPMLAGVVAAHRAVDEATIALAPLAAAARVHLLESTVAGLDAARRAVRLADGRLVDYDLLSLDGAAEAGRDRLPGARACAIFAHPAEPFLAQVEHLLDAASARSLDVAVIGGGQVGVELALALQFRLSLLGGEAGRVALVVGGERVLPAHPDKVARHAEVALNRARVTLFRDVCVEVRRDSVVLASGARVACDAPVVALEAEAPAWLGGSGLALDGHGFVVTGPTLQSGSHPEVFAVGDVATRIDAPHARGDAFAQRAAASLLANLRAGCEAELAPGAAGGAPLARHMPAQHALAFITCGRRRAIACRGAWSAQGRWVWWCKDRIDRRFVARHTVRAAAGVAAGQPAPASAPPEVIPSVGTR